MPKKQNKAKVKDVVNMAVYAVNAARENIQHLTTKSLEKRDESQFDLGIWQGLDMANHFLTHGTFEKTDKLEEYHFEGYEMNAAIEKEKRRPKLVGLDGEGLKSTIKN